MPDSEPSVPIPPALSAALARLEGLEAKYHLRSLLPAVLDLMEEVAAMLDDGKFTIWEIVQVGSKLIKLVQANRRRS